MGSNPLADFYNYQHIRQAVLEVSLHLFFQLIMLKRLISHGRSSSSLGDETQASSKRKRAKPNKVNTPVMRLALGKVARGHSAGIVSEICKAALDECGAAHVMECNLV